MSIWYRAHNTKSVKNVFSGEGGLYVSGRWNHKGRKVVYCASSISLSTIEWLSHNGLSVSGFTYNKYEIKVPPKLIKTFKLKDLPENWNKSPALNISRDFADRHLFDQLKYIAIAVPSVVVPEEYNLVINPLHPKYLLINKTAKHIGTYTAPKRLV